MSKDYSYVDVYGYNVRYITKENGCKMYFAADLIRQYNTNNGTNKELKRCLQNNDTQELIQVISKNYSVDGQRRNFTPCPLKDKNNKIYCENVIEYKSFITETQALNGYVVCLDLLHYILNWVDVKFGYTVWHYLAKEFEKGNSSITKRIHNDYIKLQEKVDELTEDNKSLQTEIREIKNKVKHDTDTSYCPYEIDQYITFIRQKDSRTFEVKKLSKKFNKRAYKQFLYDHWKDCKTKEEIDEAIENGIEPEFSDTDLTIIYARNNGVGESFKRYIINTLKDMLKDFDYIQKVTLNKIIFNRDITYDDIMQLRHLCKTIKTNIFTYKP